MNNENNNTNITINNNQDLNECSIVDLLTNVFEQKKNETEIKISDILSFIKIKGFYLLLLIFSILSVIPMPPLVDTICGVVNTVLVVQMIIGFNEVHLPKFIAEKKISQKTFSLVFTNSIKILSKLEKYTVKDRFFFITSDYSEKIFLLVLLYTNFFCLLPIMFTHVIPGIATILMCFGILNRDGLFIILGFIASLIGTIVVYYIMLGLGALLVKFIG